MRIQSDGWSDGAVTATDSKFRPDRPVSSRHSRENFNQIRSLPSSVGPHFAVAVRTLSVEADQSVDDAAARGGTVSAW